MLLMSGRWQDTFGDAQRNDGAILLLIVIIMQRDGIVVLIIILVLVLSVSLVVFRVVFIQCAQPRSEARLPAPPAVPPAYRRLGHV
jgi:hypothetical protein